LKRFDGVVDGMMIDEVLDHLFELEGHYVRMAVKDDGSTEDGSGKREEPVSAVESREEHRSEGSNRKGMAEGMDRTESADRDIVREALVEYRTRLVDQTLELDAKIKKVDDALFHLRAEEVKSNHGVVAYDFIYRGDTEDYVITVYKDHTATCSCPDCTYRHHQCKHLAREGLSYHA
jgi:hypothetical protein